MHFASISRTLCCWLCFGQQILSEAAFCFPFGCSTCISQRLCIASAGADLSSIQPGPCCREKDESDLTNGKCWDCFVKCPGAPKDTALKCQVCNVAISVTSDANLQSKCWRCFLQHRIHDHASGQALPCKNLTAAHVACPNARTSTSAGVYCNTCLSVHVSHEVIVPERSCKPIRPCVRIRSRLR